VQSVFVRQATHEVETTSHLSFGAVHVVLSTHATHCPLRAPPTTHAGPPGAPTQSAAAAHPRHTCVLVLHVGVVPAQSVFALHPTQLPLGTSHTCDPPVHCVTLVAEHCPHAPEVWHAGVVPLQFVSLVQPTHTLLALQTGFVPLQSEPDRQPTHWFTLVSQRGAAALHCASAMHVTHAPKFVLATLSQTRPPVHSLFTAQARHAFDVASQMGFVPLQSVFERQPRHVFVLVSQRGVRPPQFVSLVHPTHCPAFVPDVAHAAPFGLPVHSLLVAQARQLFDVASQTGVTTVPTQVELSMQNTHVFEDVSQTRPPVH